MFAKVSETSPAEPVRPLTPSLVRTMTTGSMGALLWWNVPTGPVTVTAKPMAIGRVSSIVHANVQGAAEIGGPTIYAVPTPVQ
jgi:hypothetical protein